MDTRERIFAVLDELNMEQKELARLLEIPADTVSAWRRKKSASYTKYLPQIAEALGTTTDYLLYGQKENTVPQEGDGLSAKDQRLLKWFRSLPPEKQRAILNLGDGPADAAD